jgi:hypothetical protein
VNVSSTCLRRQVSIVCVISGCGLQQYSQCDTYIAVQFFAAQLSFPKSWNERVTVLMDGHPALRKRRRSTQCIDKAVAEIEVSANSGTVALPQARNVEGSAESFEVCV